MSAKREQRWLAQGAVKSEHWGGSDAGGTPTFPGFAARYWGENEFDSRNKRSIGGYQRRASLYPSPALCPSPSLGFAASVFTPCCLDIGRPAIDGR